MQTLFLLANFKLFTKVLQANQDDNQPEAPPPISESFTRLDYAGDVFKTFVQDVDGVFERAVVKCYGTFVSLTEPIVLQIEIISVW